LGGWRHAGWHDRRSLTRQRRPSQGLARVLGRFALQNQNGPMLAALAACCAKCEASNAMGKAAAVKPDGAFAKREAPAAEPCSSKRKANRSEHRAFALRSQSKKHCDWSLTLCAHSKKACAAEADGFAPRALRLAGGAHRSAAQSVGEESDCAPNPPRYNSPAAAPTAAGSGDLHLVVALERRCLARRLCTPTHALRRAGWGDRKVCRCSREPVRQPRRRARHLVWR
jgi:hypothetical protein